MLRYLRARELRDHPRLAHSMFRDRAAQFRDRLGWAVTVNAAGEERDAYDAQALNAFYVIWEGEGGRHGGSLRFLPTMGPTMLADHFLHLTDGVTFRSPHIWECTRFCVAPEAPAHVAAALMLGGLEIGLAHGLSHAIGVFDARMVRIYKRLGWPPAILGTQGIGRDAISAGLWSFEAALRPVLLARAGLSPDELAEWRAMKGLAGATA